ncbi:SEC-C domain-containing protein [Alicyclobacillus sp. SO9]|uniref:SEC-C domain-containing protein n=1 Tax=Alicyclobacillus sp. SO9 TaxID=2665646 RepID=UPI0018E71D23|nr:SEC-C domain-containing protein [Alicyclobacillus sp. SO9]QQE77269.1 SEC-C domain-containing protein [Alicyclobacillus sp. SO9]
MFVPMNEAKKYQFKPYEECPCESGQKYKFCCYAKSRNSKVDFRDYSATRITAEGRRLLKDTEFKMCFAFDTSECSKDLIGAHSIQNNGVLDKISVENHVYALSSEIDQNTMYPQLEFTPIGKNQASIFSGFCKKHDEDYFKCIEDKDYEGTLEQNYWFGFRALCFELHRKLRLKKSFANFFKKYPGATRTPSIYTEYYNTKLSIRDSWTEYERFKSAYAKKSFNNLESIVKVVPFTVGFTATTSVGVGMDMEGNLAADIYNYNDKHFIPNLYVSVIPKENMTLIIISRFHEDNCYKNILSQLNGNENDEKLFRYISFCLAEYSENVYFSPAVIDSLSEANKRKIKTAFMGVLSPTPELRLRNLYATTSLNLFDLKL